MKYPAKFAGLLVCVSAGLLLLALNFLPARIEVPASAPVVEDLFDPILARRLQTIDDLLTYTDSIATAKNITLGSLDYGMELSNAIRYCFYHGYAYYTPDFNWLAWLSGKLVWDHLSAIVIPDHIMRYPLAACSQQSIVMMECLRRKGVPYRNVAFARHYALEAQLDGEWRYFDPNMEPIFPSNVARHSFHYYADNGELEKIYAHKITGKDFSTCLAFLQYGTVSGSPAPKAAIFQYVTLFLSRTLGVWLIIFGFCYYYYSGRKMISRTGRN